MTETVVSAGDLDDRYGRSRQRGFDRRFAWAAAGLLVLGGILFLILSGWQQGSRLSVQDIGFDVVDEQAVSVSFEVTAPPGEAVACAIEALNESKATVGWKVVEIPVSEQRTHTVRTTVVTTNKATAAHAKECWILAS